MLSTTAKADRHIFFKKKGTLRVTFRALARLPYREPPKRMIDFRHDLLPLKDRIYRTGLRITLNAQEAEDLTQDTLLRVWSKRHELQQVDSLEAYCLTVCRNLALDRMAKRENENLSLESVQADAPDSALTPQEQMEHDERLQRIHRLFNQLPEKMRTALQLRDIEGMSYQQAAQAMNLTEEAFKVTLHRARKALRNHYEKLENYGL